MNPQLQKLITEQDKALNRNETCLSIYHNFDNPSKNIMQTEIRNLTLNYLKKFTEEKSIELRDIAYQLGDIIFDYPIYNKSVGIFARLNFNDSKIPTLELKKNLFMIFSNTKVEDFGYVGPIFDLTSAIKMMQEDANALVLNISKEDIIILKSNNSDFEKIKGFKPIILEAMKDRYTDIYSTGEGTIIHQGGGANEKQDKFTNTILSQVFEELEKLNIPDKNYKRILVFTSSDFLTHHNKIIEALKRYSQTEPVVVQKPLKIEEDIKSHAKEKLEEIRLTSKANNIEDLKSGGITTFAEDWENVTAAARESRIYKLYLKEGFQEPGFLLNKDLPYINKELNSEPVDNITPWLIRKVIENRGEIIVLDKENPEINYPVFAALRF